MSRVIISVPEYFKKFINNSIDLEETNKICCPFHKENTPSFSYNPNTGRWRCFGACHTGGDVIDLHRMNYKLRSRVDAEKSLYKVLGLHFRVCDSLEELDSDNIKAIDTDKVELARIYNLCLLSCNTIDRAIDLDYTMSFHPVDVVRLKDLLEKWGVPYNA